MKNVYLLFVFFLSACSNDSTPVFEEISQDAIILAFGDSLTYGTGTANDTSYPSILSELSSREVINAGVPGEISRNGLIRLPSLLDEHQPELLILIHGGNDILRKIPNHQTRKNIEQMLGLAKQRDIKVVMLGVPEPNLFLMGSAEIYQQIAEQNNTPIDLETLPSILSNKKLKSDMIHPNTLGYKTLAENVLILLQKTGAL